VTQLGRHSADCKSAPVLTPPDRPTEVSRNELGLQGDGSTVLPLLLWAELWVLRRLIVELPTRPAVR